MVPAHGVDVMMLEQPRNRTSCQTQGSEILERLTRLDKWCSTTCHNRHSAVTHRRPLIATIKSIFDVVICITLCWIYETVTTILPRCRLDSIYR